MDKKKILVKLKEVLKEYEACDPDDVLGPEETLKLGVEGLIEEIENGNDL